MATITFPADQEIKDAFAKYVSALGRVAHSWNFLQEDLGKLFQSITDMDYQMASAIWYSTNSDRIQRDMLRAAVNSWPESKWKPIGDRVQGDLLALVKEADNLAPRRNDAVHAPCSIATDGKGSFLYPAFFFGNTSAKSLKSRMKYTTLLQQFSWYEACAETLSRFARGAHSSVQYPSRFPWPDKFRMPTEGQAD